MGVKRLNIGYTEDGWGICERRFDPDNLAKTETIMAQGNGYLGIRASSEEPYAGETRNCFVNGTFNIGFDNEVTELPNLPDVLAVTFEVGGEVVDFSRGDLPHYSKQLNLRTGELIREVVWRSKTDGRIKFIFSRMVSMDNLHLIAQRITVEPLDGNIDLKVTSGIDGRVTNSGTQHLLEEEKRYMDRQFMVMNSRTSQSGIPIVTAVSHREVNDGKVRTEPFKIGMKRRRVYGTSAVKIRQGSVYEIEKYSVIHTGRDKDLTDTAPEALRALAVNGLSELADTDYSDLLYGSARVWDRKVWSKQAVQIESDNPFDQVAVRFAQYHLQIMAPAHDNRMGIGAKGLTGEGYKGHSFWDTEIFILPYFLYTQPDIAKGLLEYRYLTLKGARQKAKDNGYEGAMFPWESAWLEDGEVTPLLGPADIVTGTATKILTGIIEQHISADVAYMVNRYYEMTGDEAFMAACGYELIFSTAIFWASRLEEGDDGRWHINDVIGPDEYKEHVDDNAFTNYMVRHNLMLAIRYCRQLSKGQSEVWQRLNSLLHLPKQCRKWEEKLMTLYLPEVNEDLILPQDSTYLSKRNIDLSPYRQQEQVGSIFSDYNFDQVNGIQVSKQADVMMLFYLMEEAFDRDVKAANWAYYEPRTLHDSSLSLSTHAIIASDMGNHSLAYDLFTKAGEIDLGQNMKSCDEGIHAASLGGLMQAVINGFGGVRVLGGKLRIEPHLPEAWHSLRFRLAWQEDCLEINVTEEGVMVAREGISDHDIEFNAFGRDYSLEKGDKICIAGSPALV